jgi:hypothetical protein
MSSGLLALAWVSSLQRAVTSTEDNGGDNPGDWCRVERSRTGTFFTES